MKTREHRRLTQKESYQVLKLVGDHGNIVDGWFVYDPEWDDHRIANLVSVPVGTVQARRREVFAEIERRGNPDNLKLKRYEEMERRIARLEEVVSALLAENDKGEVLLSDSARQRLRTLFEAVK